MCVHQSSCTPKLARKCEIGFPVVRTDVRAVYSHVITKFSGTGTIYLPLELRYHMSVLKENIQLTVKFPSDIVRLYKCNAYT